MLPQGETPEPGVPATVVASAPPAVPQPCDVVTRGDRGHAGSLAFRRISCRIWLALFAVSRIARDV